MSYFVKNETIQDPKKSSRALPNPPDEIPCPKKGGLRMTNFFRSVQFPKSKKIQPAPVRIFRSITDKFEHEIQPTLFVIRNTQIGSRIQANLSH